MTAASPDVALRIAEALERIAAQLEREAEKAQANGTRKPPPWWAR